jgi:UDPglucose--hexose-1-phosphate uridylyltransferase
MYRQHLTKPDGRSLTLYSRTPIASNIVAPCPVSNASERIPANPHLRWHPLRGEWVAYASHRQNRTFLPPPDYNPLMPSQDPQHPTELPVGEYDIAVFDNRFPALSLESSAAPALIVDTVPANGACEVVVFTQDPSLSLSTLSLDRLELLLEVWGDRIQVLGEQPQIQYVLPFENKGAEVGVTLHHPHGQIYAYPHIPPVPSRMLSQQQTYFQQHHQSLLPELIQKEIADGQRILYQDELAIAWVPAWARYPYEVWVAPIHSCASFTELTPAQRSCLARALKTVLLKYDGLWQRSLPYLMAWFPAPTDGTPHPEWQLHCEFYPPYRTATKLKYLAGTELAAGLFANDTLPESIAQELQGVVVHLDTNP